ncbi:E-selectin [Holothuria leucospilota]|uniref:E-selectin n=1 Tax=Holothuria leucospilota TaxID=206669 RepID=A0A9Q1BYH3_HOLLE|nr:E-selectin [Holothuria leucospilota]
MSLSPCFVNILSFLFDNCLVLSLFLSISWTRGESVCYSREQIDDLNFKVRRVPCDDNKHSLFKTFASHEDVAIADLIAISCPFNKLPTVKNGQFNTNNCTGNLVHDTCDMTCDVDYYTTTIRKTLCQNTGSNEGRWTTDNFTCDAISCPFNKLPTVKNGQFNTNNCTGNLVHDTCDMTCDVDYYTSTIRKTLCQNTGSNEGRWITDNFTCDAISCPFNKLPTVMNGQFNTTNCTGNLVHDTCDMTCDVDYYTTTIRKTLCQNTGSNEGRWITDNFTCDGESVCYSREQIDDLNFKVRRVPCDDNKHSLFKTFASHEDVAIADLIAITCPYSDLPRVTYGQFHQSGCSGNNVGDTCRMTCNTNYYTSTPKQTRCQNVGIHQGSWSNDNFICQAITCPFSDLPSVTHGQFRQSGCSGNSVGDTCDMTCETNYCTSTPKQTRCQNVGSHQGSWSNDNFICQTITCPYSDLPSVTYGQFHPSGCSGNRVGDTCRMTCNTNYYTSTPKQTRCQNVGIHQGSWSNDNFICQNFLDGYTLIINAAV